MARHGSDHRSPPARSRPPADRRSMRTPSYPHHPANRLASASHSAATQAAVFGSK